MITIAVSVMSTKRAKVDKRVRTYAIFEVDPMAGELSVVTEQDFTAVFHVTEDGKLELTK